VASTLPRFGIVFAVLGCASLLPNAVGAQPPVYRAQWGSFGSGAGQFDHPWAVAADPAGDIYVADAINHRIQKFTDTGTYLTQWGSNGSGDGQFDTPLGVATDATGNVYVADVLNYRIQKFTDTGAYVTQWGSFGTGDGEFRFPVAVVFGPRPTPTTAMSWGRLKSRYH